MLARSRRARSHRGIVGRPIEPHQCPRLPELRFRRFQILIGNVDLFFQRVQLRVLENLPPLALRNLIAGLRRLPVRRDFFVSWRRRSRGLRVARSNCATADKQQSQTRTRRNSDVWPQTSAIGSSRRRPKSEVRGPKSDARRPPSSLCPLRRLGDANGLTVHHRVRRIDDDIFTSVQAGNHFDLAAEVVAERDLLQLLPSGPRQPSATRSPSERKSSVFTGRISDDVGVGSLKMHFGIGAGEKLSGRIVHRNLDQQGARRRIDGIGRAHQLSLRSGVRETPPGSGRRSVPAWPPESRPAAR